MKTKFTFFIAAVLLTYSSYGQNVEWARKDTSQFNTQRIICVKDSNVYLYGIGANNNGSFLKCYSSQGSLMFIKTWPGNFFITRMIYSSQHFYFTANYSGNVTVDGKPLVGKGGTDGVVGKMKIDGTILWMSTIASAADESVQGICFGSGSSLVVVGKTTDSLIVNGSYINKHTQSTLLAQFSLSGGLLMSRLWDFLPQRSNYYGTEDGLQNEGLSIHFTPAGYFSPDHYYLLTTREGKHPPCCSSDTLNAPLEGYYVMRLNAVWDTLWTSYIISRQCYYGFDIGDIAVPVNDDVYITSRCNAHYGGNGFIQRLDKYTGATIWNDNKADGKYKWVVAEGEKVYTCGTDSATYCPCPSQYEGFQTLKRFDQSNSMTRIKKFNQSAYANSGLEFHKLARDGYGNTYVYGAHTSSMIVLGSDTIKRGPVNPQYFTYYLMKLGDTTAVARVQTHAISQFQVYPNPTANGCFELNTGDLSTSSIFLNVKSVNGQFVYSELIPAGQKKTPVAIKNCNKGVYILELSDGNNIWREKLIIQ